MVANKALFLSYPKKYSAEGPRNRLPGFCCRGSRMAVSVYEAQYYMLLLCTQGKCGHQDGLDNVVETNNLTISEAETTKGLYVALYIQSRSVGGSVLQSHYGALPS